jgi:hypothetical protein
MEGKMKVGKTQKKQTTRKEIKTFFSTPIQSKKQEISLFRESKKIYFEMQFATKN